MRLVFLRMIQWGKIKRKKEKKGLDKTAHYGYNKRVLLESPV